LSFAFSNHDVPRSATRQLAPLGLSENQQPALQLLLLKLETCLPGSTCVYQGEELALQDVRDIPVEQMQDPWGIEFAPTFLGRDTCRTPMVWKSDAPNSRAAFDEVAKTDSVYNQFAEFLAWRKKQPAFMQANNMTELTGGPKKIVFDRLADQQSLRCSFDFESLTATFEEI